MDTLQWNTLSKDYTHGKTCPQFLQELDELADVAESDSVQKVTFLEKYIMEKNVNRSIKEGGRRFSIPL